jgi:hypothetical protein
MDPLRNAKGALQRDLPTPDQASVRYHCLRDSGSSNGKGFLSPLHHYKLQRIVIKSTIDSISSITECFACVTGTVINEKDRSEVYNVSAPPYGRGASNLIVTSGSG